MLTARAFLVRGLLAGLVAGAVAAVVAYLGGEPSIRAAIALEELGAESGSGHTHDAPAGGVPRSLQSTLGLLTGTLLAGSTLGGLVGVLSALAVGRLGGLSPRASTLAVAAAGFVVASLVPFLAYPANPPAVGRADTIGLRTVLYGAALAISLVAAAVAVAVGRRLAVRMGGWHAALVGVTGYAVAVGVAVALLPAVNEVPADYPATVLYEFRMASLATQAALWGVIGVILAELVGRLTGAPNPSRPARAGTPRRTGVR